MSFVPWCAVSSPTNWSALSNICNKLVLSELEPPTNDMMSHLSILSQGIVT
jgi:hypothetical protein